MKAATTAEQCQNLDDLIAEVVADAEPTLLSNHKGHHAVLLSLDEFNSWQETLYLLSHKVECHPFNGKSHVVPGYPTKLSATRLMERVT